MRSTSTLILFPLHHVEFWIKIFPIRHLFVSIYWLIAVTQLRMVLIGLSHLLSLRLLGCILWWWELFPQTWCFRKGHRILFQAWVQVAVLAEWQWTLLKASFLHHVQGDYTSSSLGFLRDKRDNYSYPLCKVVGEISDVYEDTSPFILCQLLVVLEGVS